MTANPKNKEEAVKANGKSASSDFISDASEASLEPFANKSVAAKGMLTQGADQQASISYALNPNAMAFTPNA